LEEAGIDDDKIRFQEQALKRIVREYTYEAGVRNFEREIGMICRKVARVKAEGKTYPRLVTAGSIEKYLGPPQFFDQEAERQDEVGVATAIAWTENGGEIMPVEVLLMDGKGNMQITGQIGNVMQESAQAALSYLKSRSRQFNLDPGIYENLDIHIHIPEGAIPKDGPSAGITICTALVSAYTGREVRKDVGMTGEITLRGHVLPVGGIREKVLSAHRSGLKTVILPKRNAKDLLDVPRRARNELHLVLVDHIDQVLDVALKPAKSQVAANKRTAKKQKDMAQSTVEAVTETTIQEIRPYRNP
jgi:ATP-dependent Lon protease